MSVSKRVKYCILRNDGMGFTPSSDEAGSGRPSSIDRYFADFCQVMADTTGPLPISPTATGHAYPTSSNAPVVAQANDGRGFIAQVSDNPFFSAGLGLAGLGIVLTAAQKGLRQGASLMKRRLLVDVEIDVRDESYQWFLYWMTTHQRGQMASMTGAPRAGREQNPKNGLMYALMRRIAPGMHHLSIATEKIKHQNGAFQTQFALIPGPGRHLLRYQNAFIMVERVRETKSTNMHTGKPWETLTLTTLYSQRHIFEDLFTEAYRLAQQSTEGKTVVYTSRSTSWDEYGPPRQKRPLESVILDKGVKERIVGDVKEFLSSGKWYYDRGIPYRRGYLLYGRPGSGKSSFVRALAGELDYNIAMLNLSERGLTDDRLNYLLTIVPQRTLVLLEDADAAFNGRTSTDADGYRGAYVTFSGLLNAIDGVASAEERILFLTTNHIDRLDTALVRPGRVDMAVHLGEATRWQAGKLWERFYGQLDQQGSGKRDFLQQLERLGLIESEKGLQAISGASLSTAALQGLFLNNKDDMKRAIAMAPELLAGDTNGPHRPKHHATQEVLQRAPISSKGQGHG